MIINKNSVSYRWMKFWSMNIPSSLCPYVRKFVFSIIAVVGAIGLLLAFFTGIGAWIMLPKGTVFTFWIVVKCIALGAAVFASIISAVFGCCWLWDKRSEKKKAIKAAKKKEYDAKVASGEIIPKGPGLFKTYWKALHDKMCPMIEFK